LDMPGQTDVQTSLQAIANKAASQPGYRFRNLYGMVNEEMLLDSWRYIRKDAAYGVDWVSAAADALRKLKIALTKEKSAGQEPQSLSPGITGLLSTNLRITTSGSFV
jgi:hypothetical protein